ncbi:MAG TPA: hypothetical protein PLI79_01500 [Mycobacterium sp.]|nr:hypothetical protein [Mycobacterium sp.]
MNLEERRARDDEIRELHRQGLPLRVIGERVGLSLGGVQRALRRKPRAAEGNDVPTRLEQLFAAVAPAALAGDVSAATESRRLLDRLDRHERRAALVVELDDDQVQATAANAAAGRIDPAELDALELLRLQRMPGPVGDRARTEADARTKAEIAEAGSVTAWCERGF